MIESTRATDRRVARRLREAARALEAGELVRGEQYLALLAETHPGDPEVLRLQAMSSDQRGHSPEAVAMMRRALALRPDDAVFHNTLGTVLSRAGDLDGAVVALRRACELQPDFAAAWYNLGIALGRLVRSDAAIDAFRRAAQLDPGHPAIRAQLADALRDRGRTAEAAAEYRRIIADRPWAGTAWRGLADLKTLPFAPGDIAHMHAALAEPRASADDRVAIGHALAKALDDAGRCAESLAALADAKALSRDREAWDAAAFSRDVAAMHAAFTPPPAAAMAPGLGREVIFIVGLPRSGTTLAEQILAAHPAVQGSGELADLKSVLLAESRRRNTPFPEWVRAAGARDWERLGREYLHRTEAWRRERPVSTDKLPSNWLFVGAIMAMLPGARIVCCRRDPLETCFACYRQYFVRLDYAGTFGDVAAFWRDYDRTVALWRTRYPANVCEHHYEALLDDPEGTTRRLLEFCGLPWDAHCLRFHASTREVHTPSATQVRMPLRRDTARAPRYGALLDPLRAALGLPAYTGPG